MMNTHFNPEKAAPEYGDKVNVAVSWYHQETLDIPTICHFCTLDFDGAVTTAYRHYNIPQGVRGDFVEGAEWSRSTSGSLCENFGSTPLSYFTTTTYSFPVASTEPITFTLSQQDTAIGGGFVPIRSITATFQDDCTGMTEIKATYAGNFMTQRFTYGTPATTPYTFTLGNHEFIVQVIVEHDDDGSSIYGVQFYTNWGRDSGMLGPGAPDSVSTTKVTSPADNAIVYTDMLLGFERGETLGGTPSRRLNAIFGTCDGGLTR